MNRWPIWKKWLFLFAIGLVIIGIRALCGVYSG